GVGDLCRPRCGRDQSRARMRATMGRRRPRSATRDTWSARRGRQRPRRGRVMSIEREKVEALLANAVRLRPSNDPLAWMEEFALTTTEAEQIADPEWVEPGFIVEGHVVAIVAPPNGGKTTILFDLACSWARTHTVVYVDADTNPSDAKYRLARAQRRGVRYLTPDLKVGKSMRDVVTHLERMAASDIDLTRQVWIFDTLK